MPIYLHSEAYGVDLRSKENPLEGIFSANPDEWKDRRSRVWSKDALLEKQQSVANTVASALQNSKEGKSTEQAQKQLSGLLSDANSAFLRGHASVQDVMAVYNAAGIDPRKAVLQLDSAVKEQRKYIRTEEAVKNLYMLADTQVGSAKDFGILFLENQKALQQEASEFDRRRKDEKWTMRESMREAYSFGKRAQRFGEIKAELSKPRRDAELKEALERVQLQKAEQVGELLKAAGITDPDEADRLRRAGALKAILGRDMTGFDAWAEKSRDPSRFLPFIGAAGEIAEVAPLISAAIKAGRGENLTEAEEGYVEEWMASMGSDPTFMHEAVTVITDMLPFMLSLGTTSEVQVATKGGIAALSKSALQSISKGLVARQAAKRGVEGISAARIDKLASKSITTALSKKWGWAAERVGTGLANIGGIAVQTVPASIDKITSEALQNHYIPGLDKLEKTDAEGIRKWLSEPGMPWGQAWTSAYLTWFVENVSENFGEVLDPVLGKAWARVAKWPKSQQARIVKEGLLKRWLASGMGKVDDSMGSLTKLARRARVNSLISEMGEELFGDALSGTVHWATEGKYGEEYEAPTPRDIALYLTSFSPMTLGSAVLYNRSLRKGKKQLREAMAGSEHLALIGNLTNAGVDSGTIAAALNKRFEGNTDWIPITAEDLEAQQKQIGGMEVTPAFQALLDAQEEAQTKFEEASANDDLEGMMKAAQEQELLAGMHVGELARTVAMRRAALQSADAFAKQGRTHAADLIRSTMKIAAGMDMDLLTKSEQAAWEDYTDETGATVSFLDNVEGRMVVTDAGKQMLTNIVGEDVVKQLLPMSEGEARQWAKREKAKEGQREERAKRREAARALEEENRKLDAEVERRTREKQAEGTGADRAASGGVWTAVGQDGTKVSIPQSEAATEEEAGPKLAAKLPGHEMLDIDSVKLVEGSKRGVETPTQEGSTSEGGGQAAPQERETPRTMDRTRQKLSDYVEAHGASKGGVERVLDLLDVLDSLGVTVGSGSKAVFSSVEFTNDPDVAMQVDTVTGKLLINIEEFRKNIENKQHLTGAAIEEVIHAVALRAIPNEQVKSIWKALPDDLKRTVLGSHGYHDNWKTAPLEQLYADSEGNVRSDFQMGHEFLRMVISDKLFAGQVTEAARKDESFGRELLELLRNLVDYLREHVAKLEPKLKEAVEERIADVAAMMDELGIIYDGKAPESARQAVEMVRQQQSDITEADSDEKKRNPEQPKKGKLESGAEYENYTDSDGNPAKRWLKTSSGLSAGDKIHEGTFTQVKEEDDQSTPETPREYTVVEVKEVIGENTVTTVRRDMTPAEAEYKRQRLEQENEHRREMELEELDIPEIPQSIAEQEQGAGEAEGDMFGDMFDDEAGVESRLDNVEFPIFKVPLEDIHHHPGMPNFKEGADPKTGVVAGEQLGGKFDTRGVAPIILWEAKDGKLYIVTGRHRLDLARRSGEKAISSQIFKETDGFSIPEMLTIDAEFNIRDGNGTIEDYARYFRNSNLTRAQAEERGLLARAKGKKGWAIGHDSSDALFALYEAGKITEARAVAIAETAPGDEAAQRVGIKYALEKKDPFFIRDVMRATARAARASHVQMDLFGADDSAMREMERQARRANSLRAALQHQVTAARSAAKRPEAARKMGVDVNDPEAVQGKIDSLLAEIARWENWPLHPDLVAKVVGDEGLSMGKRRIDQAPDGTDLFEWAASQAAAHQSPLSSDDNPTKKRGVGNAVKTRINQAKSEARKRKVEIGAIAALHSLRRTLPEDISQEDIKSLKSAFRSGKGSISNVIKELVTNAHAEPWNIVGSEVKSKEDWFLMNAVFRNPHFESLRIAVLNEDREVVHAEVLNIGTNDESIVDIPRIVMAVERARAAGVKNPSVLISHNHPGGDPSPSDADHKLTSRVRSVLESIGSTLLDHVVTNGTEGYSFTAEATFPMLDSEVPWVHSSRAEMPQIGGPEDLASIAAALRAAKPNQYYLVALSTRSRIISVDQITSDPERIGRAAISIMTQVGARKAILLGEGKLWQNLELTNRLNKELSDTGLRLIDSVVMLPNGSYTSHRQRQAGLLEESTQYLPMGRRSTLTPEQKAEVERQTKEATERLLESNRVRRNGAVVAPNAKASKLYQSLLEEVGDKEEALRRYAMVHTPFFKRWFGDWEGLEKREALLALDQFDSSVPSLNDLSGRTLIDAAKALHEPLQGDFTMPDGRRIKITGNGFREVRHHSADPRVMHIAANLRSLLGRSVHLWTEDSNDSKRPNVRAFHHYGTRATVAGIDSYIRFVIREDNNGEIHYDHDATSVEAVSRNESGKSADPPIQKPSPGEDQAGLAENRLVQWLASVNPDSVSKVRDENGEPLLVWHGTSASWNTWDGEKAGGLVNLAFDRRTGEKYAGGGGGGRRGLTRENSYLETDDGKYRWDGNAFAIVDRYFNGAEKSIPLDKAIGMSRKGEAWYAPIEQEVKALFANTRNALDLTTRDGEAAFHEILESIDQTKIKGSSLRVFRGLSNESKKRHDIWGDKGKAAGSYWELTKTEHHTKLFRDVINPALRAAGYDGIRLQDDSHETLAVFRSNQIKSATGNDGTWSGEDNNILSMGRRKVNQASLTVSDFPLSAVHNLTAENLAFADEMGGIPVPSIAVMKPGGSNPGFGEIALIGGRELADPESNPVYDGDAYSPRFPELIYSKVKFANAEKFIEQRKKYEDEFGGHDISQTWRDMVNYPDPERIISRFQGSNAIKAQFIYEVLEKDALPVMEDARLEVPWVTDHRIKQLLDEGKISDTKNRDLSEKEEQEVVATIRDVIRDHVNREFKNIDLSDELKSNIMAGHERRIIDENGKLFFSLMPLHRSIKAVGTRVVDQTATREHLDSIIGDRREEFEAWVQDQVLGQFDAPSIKVKGKKRALTLENVVDAMKGRVKGLEAIHAFTYGMARAMAAKKFRSLEQMREHGKESLKAGEETKTRRKRVEDTLSGLLDELSAHYRYDSNRFSIGAQENGMRAVVDYLRGAKTNDGMAHALRANGFQGYSEDLVARFRKAAEEFAATPVPYFESKPQRAVGLNEFEGAAVPKDASKETLAILQKHGIKVAKYDPDVEGDRERAIVELDIPAFSRAKKGAILPESNVEALQQQARRLGLDDVVDVVYETGSSTLPDTARASRAETSAAQTFRQNLAQYEQGTLPTNVILTTGRTGAVLQAVGAPDVPVTITQGILDKAKHHGIALESLRDLPEQINDPVMVFRSSFGDSRRVVVTELKAENGRPVIVAIDIDTSRQRIGHVVDIRSVHAKEHVNRLMDWAINKGRLLYWDKEKAQAFLQDSAPSNWEQYAGKLGHLNATTSGDIVKGDGEVSPESVSPESRSTASTWEALYDPKRKGKRVVVNAAVVTPSQLQIKVEHEVGHHIYRTKGFQKEFNRLWKAIPEEARKRISDQVEDLYSDSTDSARFEEKRVRALELIREAGQGTPEARNAWQRFLRWLRVVWKSATGQKLSLDEAQDLAAKMVADGLQDLRRGLPGHEREGGGAPVFSNVRPDGTTAAQFAKEKAEILAKAERDSQGRLLAPNGKASNLTEDQWATVRTKAFKEWFGDWRALAEATPQRAARTVDEANQMAREFTGQPITNKDDGLTVTLSRNTLDKMLSGSAVQKSASPEIHTTAVANLELLFQNAIRGFTGADERGDSNITAMHRYYAPMVYNGKVHVAKITVKQFARESEGSRLYTVESVEMVKPAGDWVASISENRRNYTPQAGFREKLRAKLEAVNPESVSKVVDENGEPMVVYHGSPNSGFQTFRGNKRGIFFSSDLRVAASYSGSRRPSEHSKNRRDGIYPIFLNMRSPYKMDFHGANWDGVLYTPNPNFVEGGTEYRYNAEQVIPQSTRNVVNEAWKMEGVDGALIANVVDIGPFPSTYFNSGKWWKPDTSTIFAAFNPSQIKSATENVGTFDRSNPDIRYSLAPESTDGRTSVEAGTPWIQADDGRVLTGQGDVTILHGAVPEVYHGTPHKVEKFSTDKIGTGEGNAAFGYGLYLAQRVGVAESYRDKLTRSGESGNLYTVKISADEDALLEWDGMIADRSEIVRDALAGLKESQGMGSIERDEGKAGREIYRELASKLGSQREASEALSSVGIAGIRYLDGDSRNRGLDQAREKFLDALPENADFSELNDAIDAGEFDPEMTEFLEALRADDWLGFNWPAQAISTTLTSSVANYDISPELRGIIDKLRGEQTYNYVIFNENDLEIVAENGNPVKPSDVLHSASVDPEGAPQPTKPNDPVYSPTGHLDWSTFTKWDAKASKGKIKALPIRVLLGKHYGPHNGFGLAHAKEEHLRDIAPFNRSLEEFIHHVLLDFNEAYLDGGRITLVANRPKSIAVVELREEAGGFYSVVTAFPKENPAWQPRGARILGGRKAAFAQSETAPTPTAQGQTSPKPPLEPLVGKDSWEYFASLRENVKPDSSAKSDDTLHSASISPEDQAVIDAAVEELSESIPVLPADTLPPRTDVLLADRAAMERYQEEVFDMAAFARNEKFVAETFELWDERAELEIKHDRAGVILRLLEAANSGEGIRNAVDVRAAMMLLPQMRREAMAS